jgi:hypothetical protein
MSSIHNATINAAINAAEQPRVVAGLSGLAILMLLWSIFGYPPYIFFGLMRAVVFVGGLIAAHFLWQRSRIFWLLPAALALISLIHLALFAIVLTIIGVSHWSSAKE